MNIYAIFFLIAVMSYLLGSVPFALVIGKLFYQTDIRNYGSKNLGGGNAGRVLGKKSGLAVMTMDILKVTLAVFIASRLQGGEAAMVLAGLAAATGHCFALFAQFKGRKAVATMYGFLFGMGLFGGYGLSIFFVPLIVFLIVLYLGKIIALGSIASAAAVTGYLYFISGASLMFAAAGIFTVVIIVRHKKNLIRIKNHEENKISWM